MKGLSEEIVDWLCILLFIAMLCITVVLVLSLAINGRV